MRNNTKKKKTRNNNKRKNQNQRLLRSTLSSTNFAKLTREEQNKKRKKKKQKKEGKETLYNYNTTASDFRAPRNISQHFATREEERRSTLEDQTAREHTTPTSANKHLETSLLPTIIHRSLEIQAV